MKFKYSDVEITVSQYGRFTAQLGDVEIAEESLADAKRAIDAAQRANIARQRAVSDVAVWLLVHDRRHDNYRLAQATWRGVGTRGTHLVTIDGDKMELSATEVVFLFPTAAKEVGAYIDAIGAWLRAHEAAAKAKAGAFERVPQAPALNWYGRDAEKALEAQHEVQAFFKAMV